jgi:DNA-binding response OmpR family regulator
MESHATALLVVDDPMTVDVVRTALAGEPTEFDVAFDLATAIRCLDSGRYGGVIVDLALPQGSGFDVLRYMSSRAIVLPTVVISKKIVPESVLAREQVKLVLSKPVDTALLLNVIRGLCRLASASTKDVAQPRHDRRPAAPEELRDPDFLWHRL